MKSLQENHNIKVHTMKMMGAEPFHNPLFQDLWENGLEKNIGE